MYQNVLRAFWKGPAHQYEWEIPATIVWHLPVKKVYCCTLFVCSWKPFTSCHLTKHSSISTSQASMREQDLRSCCSDPSTGEEKTLGKAQAHLQKGKVPVEERSCCRASVWSTVAHSHHVWWFLEGPNLTDTCCTVDLAASCRNIRITVCAAAWIDTIHTGLPDIWSSCTDTAAWISSKPCWAAGRTLRLPENFTSYIPYTPGFTPVCVHWQHVPLDGKKELSVMERKSSTAQRRPSQQPEWSPLWVDCVLAAKGEIFFLYTSPSLFCSKDLDGGSEIQCEAWDRCGFIPDWEVKVPTMLFLMWRASYLAV